MAAYVETLKRGDEIKSKEKYWHEALFTAFDLQNTSEHLGRRDFWPGPGRISDEGSFVSMSRTFPSFLCPLAAAASPNCFSCSGLSSSLTGAA